MSGSHNFSPTTILFTQSLSFLILTVPNSACWHSRFHCILRPKCCFKAARKWLICIHFSLAPLFLVTPEKPPTTFGNLFMIILIIWSMSIMVYFCPESNLGNPPQALMSYASMSLRCILFNIEHANINVQEISSIILSIQCQASWYKCVYCFKIALPITCHLKEY